MQKSLHLPFKANKIEVYTVIRGGVGLQKQATIAAEAAYTGVGLHSGREVHMVLKPAPEDTGLVFVRTDLPSPRKYS